MSFATIKKTVPACDGQGSVDRYPLAPIHSDAAARRSSYLATTALTAALLSILAGGIRPAASANFTWDGPGATTTTNNYNLDTNWGPATAPIAAGQVAIFANTGNTSVNVTAGPITPDSWTFNANSQSYSITGQAVNFATGITNNASAGQSLIVTNSMTGTTLSQTANSILTIGGTNSFTNTTITGGILVNNGHLTSAINNSASFDNGGTVTGPLTNTGTVNAFGGAINGNVTNSTGGAFHVTGAVTSDSAFTNTTASSLLSIAGTGSIIIDGIGSGYGFGLVNSGAAASGGGVTLSVNGYLRVGYGIQNNAGADILNAGTINSGGALLAYADNLGNIANTGTFFGLVTNENAGTIGNSGTWNGELTDNRNTTTANAVDNQNVWAGDATNHGNLHNSGTWTTITTGTGFRNRADGVVSQTAGIIDATLGGFSNIGTSAAHSAIVNFSGGAINGAITNGPFGTFNVLGSVTSDSSFDNTAASSLLSLGSGASYTVGGLLTNAGTVVVANGATLTATAGGITNAAGGTITVNAGGTIVDDLSNAGTVVNNGAYVANVASNTGAITNAGVWTGDLLSNTGSVVNSGGATWNGDAANSGTLLNAGTLNGNLTNLAGTTINTGTITGVSVNGGMLTGDGSTGALTVTSGGRFAPGNGTPGTSATVNGNLILQAGAFYQVAINPATASFANVTGTATLGGAAVNAVYANGGYVAKHYTILTAAGGVNGSFSGPVNTNLPQNFTSSLNYDTNNAYLDLALGFSPGNGGGLNVNQANVANALTSFFNTNSGIPIAFGTLNSAGLTTASGELATGAQQTTFNAMRSFSCTSSMDCGEGFVF